MSLDNPKNYKIIEGNPGEKNWLLIARSIRERAKSTEDLILRMEINGLIKEVIITEQSTQQTVSKDLFGKP